MESSFIISSMCCLILITMSVLVQSNASITKVQRRGFIRTFIIVIVLILLELATLLLNGSDVSLRFLHIVTNYLGFALSPIMVFSIIISITHENRIKDYLILSGLYIILLAISLPFNVLFSIDNLNRYTRSEGFIIFVIWYLFCILLLMFESMKMYSKYRKSQKRMLVPILILTVVGSSVQVIDPDLHITWLSITFMVILYYVQCSNLWHQIDGLTGLLTQKVYLYDLERIKACDSVYVFDIDYFKKLNDDYGHYIGDEALRKVGNLIQDVFGKYGTCYRIGGDEMSVIVHKKCDYDNLVADFHFKLYELREESDWIPTVSVGCAVVGSTTDSYNLYSQADKDMYYNKSNKSKLQ